MNSEVYGNAVIPHERILECFKKHDAGQAVLEMQRHLDITSEDMRHLHEA